MTRRICLVLRSQNVTLRRKLSYFHAPVIDQETLAALTTTTATLSDVSKLTVACKDLLPLIMTALGLP